MAGHSKWANIKHKKKANDIKKSKLFSKLANDIKNSTNESNKDIKSNVKLKKAVDKALSNNMSKSIINNIIGQSDLVAHDKSFYAAVGYDGVTFIIECFDSNKNRMIGELRYLLNQYTMTLVPIKTIEYLFLKYAKIKLVGEYNEKYLYNYFSEFFLNSIIDDTIYIDFFKSKDLISILKLLNIDLEVFNCFFPKTCLYLDFSILSKMSELVSKLKKLSYMSNVFYNFKI